MSRITLTHLGWWSRFNLSQTVEISGVLKRLPKAKILSAQNHYRKLQHWTELYPISGDVPFEVKVNYFSKVVGLQSAFNLRREGLFRPITHKVFAFRVLTSGVYILYGRDNITLHCFPDESPVLIQKVLSRLYTRSIIPYIRNRVRRKKNLKLL
jgi:hypothetical protein